MAFVTESGAFDRAQIMREAHRLYRRAPERLTFATALRMSWSRARAARVQRLAKIAAFHNLAWAA